MLCTADTPPVGRIGVSMAFTPELVLIGAVRQWVASTAPQLRAEEHVDVLALVCSELAANAVKEVRSSSASFMAGSSWCGHISVTLSRLPDWVRLECWDPFGARLPTLNAETDDEHGRGLCLVDALSAQWGYRMDDHTDGGPYGKTVFAEVAAERRCSADSYPIHIVGYPLTR